MSFLSLKDSCSVLGNFLRDVQIHILASTAFKMVNHSVTTSKHRNERTCKVTDFFAAGHSALLQLWWLACLLFMASLTSGSFHLHLCTFVRTLLIRAISPCFINRTHHSENIHSFSLWKKLSLKKAKNQITHSSPNQFRYFGADH